MASTVTATSPVVSVVVQSGSVEQVDVEIHQSAEILFRELKVRGLAASFDAKDALVIVSLSERSLQQGGVELISKRLNRRALVDLEEAVDKTMEWVREINVELK